jgi:hypothetical protein
LQVRATCLRKALIRAGRDIGEASGQSHPIHRGGQTGLLIKTVMAFVMSVLPVLDFGGADKE